MRNVCRKSSEKKKLGKCAYLHVNDLFLVNRKDDKNTSWIGDEVVVELMELPMMEQYYKYPMQKIIDKNFE